MKEYKCSVCGKIFKRYACQVTKGSSNVCCSKRCLWRKYSTTMKGSGNPNYRHGGCIDDKVCECGNSKDTRSRKCARCARKGYVRKGAMPIFTFSLKEFRKIVRFSNSYVTVGKKSGVGRNFAKGLILAHNIDVSHFVNSGKAERFYRKEDLFVKSDDIRSRGMIKNYIMREKLIPHLCKECGRGPTWNKKPLTLQLHHKDGNKKNNMIDNLEFLCPNCHSQTNTYTGRNIVNALKERKEFGVGEVKNG